MNHIANTKSISENILALFIFYSALFQYKVIVDNIYLFDDFLEQLERLYRKIDNYNELRISKCQILYIYMFIVNIAY